MRPSIIVSRQLKRALNGYLTWHDRPFQRTHDLSELVQLSSDVDESLLELQRAAKILTPYAIQFRYPADALEPDPTDVLEAIRLTQQVLDLVKEHLPARVHEDDVF